ncbi:mechanosensitive ion channel [Pelomonas sp. V22]|nr:mechanosensitive ion channel [Pelomonas sp. V22]
MNQPLSMNELQELLAALLKPAALTELASLLACLGLAWLIVWRVASARAANQQRPLSVLFGRHVIDGVLFPALALLLAFGARRLLIHFGVHLALFKLAIPVLVSLLAIRFTVRVLTVAMPESTGMRLVERFVSWVAWLGSIIWITGLWPDLLKELESYAWKIGGKPVTLLDMLQGGLAATVVLVLSLWISSVIEARLMQSSSIDLSMRKIAVSLTRAALLFVGMLVALSAAGIDLTALGVLGGALGVGIGFGLQKLAANYVSGFVILAERSLRIGDMVKVDGFEGRISDIKTRYTVIRALNGREAIVPNETLITTRVENSSLADPQVLLSTVVQVAYGCDVEQVMKSLAAAVASVPRVLATPEPGVQLSNFAADGLELTVTFWIGDPQNGQGGVRSDVNLAVLRTLQGLGVEIPYPQRVLHQAASGS